MVAHADAGRNGETAKAAFLQDRAAERLQPEDLVRIRIRPALADHLTNRTVGTEGEIENDGRRYALDRHSRFLRSDLLPFDASAGQQ
jgi:hypothetical protein